MLVDQDVLVDAGTGVADLSTTELAMIDHVFLTHHLDHIASLPLMVDTGGPPLPAAHRLWHGKPSDHPQGTIIFNLGDLARFSRNPDGGQAFHTLPDDELGQTVGQARGRQLTPAR